MKKAFYYYFLASVVLSMAACKPEKEDPPPTPEPLRGDNLLLGNPSNAVADINLPDNYLLIKDIFTLSYNNTKGTANWVSWHLHPAWKGSTPRQNNFNADNDLPTGFKKVVTTDYTNTGFDRGHICPSEDRDSTVAENSTTFLMTNMIPQSPNNNRGTWASIEDYGRTLMGRGNELYIVAGPMGEGGESSSLGILNTIASGKIVVPAYTWKVMLIIPQGEKDLDRISSSTRVIAVKVPNRQNVTQNDWGTYRVSVDQLEAELGYDFLSKLPAALQQTLEANPDTGSTN